MTPITVDEAAAKFGITVDELFALIKKNTKEYTMKKGRICADNPCIFEFDITLRVKMYVETVNDRGVVFIDSDELGKLLGVMQ